jgi:LCP family protein required for cell wall assembly
VPPDAEVALPQAVATAGETPAVVEIVKPSRRTSWKAIILRVILALTYGSYVIFGAWLGFVYVVAPTLALAEARMAAANADGRPEVSRLPFPPLIVPIEQIADIQQVFLPEWQGRERINILLMGIDQREEERRLGLPTRSDTVIVVSIDPVLKTATMISFPRDLWVTIPGYGEDRINVAYRYGELRRLPGGGPGLAARTLEQNFGLKLPYYATVDFRGFEDVVNTVGGIVVDVPRPLKDDAYPTEDYGVERIYFPSGPQLMDGATALKYARTRHADSDFGRMARQQQVLFAIRDRALRLNMLPRLPGLIDQGLRSVQTNFTATEMLALGKLASDIDTTALGTLAIDNQLVRPTTGWGGASLLMPKKDEIRRAIERAMTDPRLIKEAARVEVATAGAPLNLVAETGDRLAGEGLQVMRASAAAQGSDLSTTRIVVYSEKPRAVQAIVRALGLTERAVLHAQDEESDADVLVLLGRDFALPPMP